MNRGFMTASEFALASIKRLEAENNKPLQEAEKAKIRNRELNAITESYYASLQEGVDKANKFMTYSSNVKKALLAECINSVYQSVIECNRHDATSIAISKNLVNKLIEEQGVSTLLNRFKTKNILLSEYYSLIEKYYNKIVTEADEKAKEDNASDNYGIDVTVKDNFFDELNMAKPEDVILNIRTRVSDAVQEFIDSNTEDKMDIKDILQQVQDRVNSTKVDEVKESYRAMGEAQIRDIRNKPKKLFGYMVESVSKGVMKDEALKEYYMKDERLDMDKIVENCELMYTLLEVVNTTGMVKVDEAYIQSVVDAMK